MAIPSMQNKNGKFHNSETRYSSSLGDTAKIVLAFLTAPKVDRTPDDLLPIKPIAADQLCSANEDCLFRLGHSTLLMKIDGLWVLTDPVLSERASPVQWAGPKRFHPSPISAEDLPFIDVVVISHDHYDHLDKNTIQTIQDKVGVFITPLKVGSHLRRWGVSHDNIIELDWWQTTTIKGVELIATPSQHFSGRSLFDRDTTLWSSWVIIGNQRRIFFSGDSGYFSGFKEIGERYGPFDFTLIEAGAYNRLWQTIHMMPEESVKAHLDLRGKVMIPIHNGTFDLSMHAWHEPLSRVSDIAAKRDVQILTPIFGEQVLLDNPVANSGWWQAPPDFSQLETAKY